MKRRSKIIIASIMAAVIIAAAPAATLVPVTLTAEAATLPEDMKEVTATGDLEVKVPTNVSDSYEVKAYEMLQLVIPKGTTWTATDMTNNTNSQNVYVVTDNFKAFFEKAKNTYNSTTTPLTSSDTLYLTYDATNNRLDITADGAKVTDKTVNEDYIVIDNKEYSSVAGDIHKGKLDKKYFEADLVSRIVDSDPIAGETNASAARLLSDWASRYIKAKSLTAEKTADKVYDTIDRSKVTGFKFSGLVYGYYVVVTNDDSQDNDKSVINQSILNVPQATNVTLKATPITIDKSVSNLVDANLNNNEAANKSNGDTTKLDVDENGGTKYDKITANIGDVLQYKVASHIPSLTSYDLEYAGNDDKLLDIDTPLDKRNFSSTISGKYVYTFRDTMTNQDFIPVDTIISNVDVKGLKMEITYKDSDGNNQTATYVVKNDADGAYYLVLETDTATKNNAIGRLWETNYGKVTVEGNEVYQNFFAINFDLKKLKEKEYDGGEVVFTYNAELKGETGNADAVNNATLTYSNDPFDSSSTDTISDDDKVYTYDVKIDKLFSDGATTDFYNKVTFKLYSQDSSVNTRKAIKFVRTSDGTYTRVDSDDATTTDVLAINTTDGTLLLHGLGEGTYYLVEQENDDLKNAGYNIVNPITIVVTAKDNSSNAITDSTNFDLFSETTVEGNTTYETKTKATLDTVDLNVSPIKVGDSTVNQYGVEFDVINQKGFKLPLTGEYGNWALAIAGILIVAVSGTVIVLVNRKKKDTSADNEA